MTAPEERAPQAGDGERVCGTRPGGLQPSKRQHHMISRHASAGLAWLSPEAARWARNLQNFFPFPLQEEEEEALEDDDVEEVERNDEPGKDPAAFWSATVENAAVCEE